MGLCCHMQTYSTLMLMVFYSIGMWSVLSTHNAVSKLYILCLHNVVDIRSVLVPRAVSFICVS